MMKILYAGLLLMACQVVSAQSVVGRETPEQMTPEEINALNDAMSRRILALSNEKKIKQLKKEIVALDAEIREIEGKNKPKRHSTTRSRPATVSVVRIRSLFRRDNHWGVILDLRGARAKGFAKDVLFGRYLIEHVSPSGAVVQDIATGKRYRLRG